MQTQRHLPGWQCKCGRIMIPADLTKENAEKELTGDPDVQRIVGDRQIVKVIFVPGRLLNIVVR